MLSACASRTGRPARPDSLAQSAHPAQPALQHDLDAILNDPALARGTWGVVVRSLKNGETLYALNAQKLLIPASNMKIVTLAAAAETLGWDYQYETKLFLVNGDLVVVGTGDPSIALFDGSADRVFGDWAARLSSLGVRTIARIVGDDNAFEDQTLGFGWSWDDLPDDYAAGVGALQFNENAVRITVAPGPNAGDYAVVRAEPAGIGVEIVSTARTSAAGGATALTTNRLPGSQRLAIGGTIAVGATPSTLTVAVDNPTLFFVQALKQALIARGIDVRGPAVDADDVADAPTTSAVQPIATHRSPALSVLAERLMKVSQNQYAETFLKSLSAGSGSPASAVAGRAVVADVLNRWGIPPGALIQRDGSGLSRYDYVTADALAAILVHVHNDAKLRGPFEASLPVVGREGTVANRMKETPADRNARAKSGSMSNVRGLSGYVTTADGELLAFAILANNFETAADVVNRATDAIVVRLASLKR